jgi:hypothetical protein
MYHHHDSNLDWQMQQQIQLEQIAVWQLWSNNRQQRHTNDLLAQNNALQQQNNYLLEQIRRNSLTPAQRAAEDAQRAREAVLRAAQAQLEAERKKKFDRFLFWAMCCLVILGIAGFMMAGSHTQANTPALAAQNASYTAVESTPVPVPRAEIANPTPKPWVGTKLRSGDVVGVVTASDRDCSTVHWQSPESPNRVYSIKDLARWIARGDITLDRQDQ